MNTWIKDRIDKWWDRRRRNRVERWWEGFHKEGGDFYAEDVANFFNHARGVCPFCGEQFDMPGTLRQHVIDKHQDALDKIY